MEIPYSNCTDCHILGDGYRSSGRDVIPKLLVNVLYALKAVQSYRELAPMALAGAEKIHVDAGQAAITASLTNSCDSNYSMPGIFSLYFWTSLLPIS